MCFNIETPNNHHFQFGTNGKVVVLGVPILKHFRVAADMMGAILGSNSQSNCSIVQAGTGSSNAHTIYDCCCCVVI